MYSMFCFINASLNRSLGGLSFGYDETEQKYGYYVTDSEGADTFLPFSNAELKLLGTIKNSYDISTGKTITLSEDIELGIVFAYRSNRMNEGSLTVSVSAGTLTKMDTGSIGNAAGEAVDYAYNQYDLYKLTNAPAGTTIFIRGWRWTTYAFVMKVS